MKQIRFIRDYGYGSVSDMKKILAGNIYDCPDDAKSDDLIARGFAVEVAFGWIRQPEDKRDYTVNFALLPGKKDVIPATSDLRTTGFMPPVVDQGNHGTCTANAKAGINGFMEAKQGHVAFPFSRNFVYYETVKNIEHGDPASDPGATIRGTFSEGKKFGACKETSWHYDDTHFGKAPNAISIAEALNYQDISYASLDPIGSTPAKILTNVKTMIVSGVPVEFGFDVYASFMKISKDGLMPYPKVGEAYQGGHAVDVVGYDDNKQCPNASKGALLIRNSWGTSWGLAGYFWMPYDIITKAFNGRRMASDFWSLGRIEWMNKGVE